MVPCLFFCRLAKPNHPPHCTIQNPSHTFLYSAWKAFRTRLAKTKSSFTGSGGEEEQCHKCSEICIFSCPVSSAIWDGVKPGPDVICKGGRARCRMFRHQGEFSDGCRSPSVGRTGPLVEPPPLPQMGREKPEEEESNVDFS